MPQATACSRRTTAGFEHTNKPTQSCLRERDHQRSKARNGPSNEPFHAPVRFLRGGFETKQHTKQVQNTRLFYFILFDSIFSCHGAPSPSVSVFSVCHSRSSSLPLPCPKLIHTCHAEILMPACTCMYLVPPMHFLIYTRFALLLLPTTAL